MGAASVAAKVTRDACVEGWVFEEGRSEDCESNWSNKLGSGYPSGEVAVSVLNCFPSDQRDHQTPKRKNG